CRGCRCRPDCTRLAVAAYWAAADVGLVGCVAAEPVGHVPAAPAACVEAVTGAVPAGSAVAEPDVVPAGRAEAVPHAVAAVRFLRRRPFSLRLFVRMQKG